MINKLGYVIKYIINHIVDFPLTVYFNYRVLPWKQALKLPIWISHNTKFSGIRKNVIKINGHCSFAMIQYGLWGINGVSNTRKGYIGFGPEIDNLLIFNGPARFGTGTYISVDKGAKVDIGENFSANNNLMIRSHYKIRFGKNVMIGWDVSIMDSDNHELYVNNIKKKNLASISIGNHVWIAAKVDILKGTEILDGSVVGYRSLVTKRFGEKNVLLIGSPAKIASRNVRWDY